MTTFFDFALSEPLLRALKDKGFEKPTPIQAKAIPQILESEQDIMALAQTGTGKTAAFSLPVLSKLDTSEASVQCVVLSPTRELAMQIANDMSDFSKHLKGLKVATVYGGAPIVEQIKQVKRGAQVVVGTPGRMVDLIRRRALKLENVQWVVLDEADEMLNMGFVEDLTTILSETPENKQTLLFSATMSRSVANVAKNYMKKPLRIEVEATPTRERAITHQVMFVSSRNRMSALKRFLELHEDMYGIVFCRTKRETQEVADQLQREGVAVGVLHGDIEQRHRTRIMNAFKKKESTMLIATDVAARGIDVEKLTHVMHFGVPEQTESYVHRSGRTGRASNEGHSVVFAHMREHRLLKNIERATGIRFEEITVPKRKELIEAEIGRYVEQVESQKDFSSMAQHYAEEMLKDIPRSQYPEVAKQILMVALEERIAKFPEDELDRELSKPRREHRDDRSDRSDRGGRSGRDRKDDGMVKLVVNVGRDDNMTVPHLLGMINEVTPGERVDVGRIQINDANTSFMVDKAFVGLLKDAMPSRKFKGQKIMVKESSGRYGGSRERSSRSRGDRGRRPRR